MSEAVDLRARRSVRQMLVRHVVLYGITLSGGVLLARWLTPAAFGLFNIATFWVSVLSLIGDFGLAPSFIQRKAELTDRDLSVGFTVQQFLITIVVVLLWLGSPWIAAIYPDAPPETVWLVRTLAITLFFISWRTMSALQLERQLRYDRIAMVEVVEAFVYYGIALGMAYRGAGAWSFVAAALARCVVGTVLIFISAPWKIRLGYDGSIARTILRYGIPFQLQAIASQAGSWVTPTLVARLIGPQAVGYVVWANGQGSKPLQIVNSVLRVAFPHISRLQDDPEAVSRALERYVVLLLIPGGLWFSAIATAGPLGVEWIFAEKWLPAVAALTLYAFSVPMDTLTQVVGFALNGTGKVAITTRAIAVRNIVNLGSSIPLVFLLGFNGIPVAYLLGNLASAPLVLRGLGKEGAFRLLRAMRWLALPVIAGVGLGRLSLLLGWSLVPQLFVTAGIATGAYLLIGWALAPAWLREEARAQVRRRLAHA